MEFRILGPLEVLDGDVPVEVAGSKRRAVLALLILRANEVVRSERLIDELWGERPPRNAAAALHNHVSRLRKALGADVLVRREWGYVLRAAPETIDLHRFEALVAAPSSCRRRSARGAWPRRSRSGAGDRSRISRSSRRSSGSWPGSRSST